MDESRGADLRSTTDVARRRSEQRLALAFASARLGAWEYELATRRLTASPQCKANHGLGPDDDLQLDTDILPSIDAGHRRRFLDALDRAIATGGSFEIEVPIRWPDGTDHWLFVAGKVADETCMVGVTRDVTERRRAEQALRESEESLRQADRLKDEFLAVVAHELKGPLAPILMAVRLLQMKGPDVPELRRLRETIYRQTIQLSKVVNDLLDIGRITAGKLHVDAARVELGAVVRQAVEMSAPLVEKRRHTLSVHMPEAPIYLQADGARLVQVVSNLLNNAAKYMQDRGRIELAVLEEDGSAVIRVRDEGVGIAPEMLDRIFHRFVQVGASRRLAEGGLGIGLSLVKAVVEAHGGTVDAHSEGVGRGSVFTVRVPLLIAPPVPGAPPEFARS